MKKTDIKKIICLFFLSIIYTPQNGHAETADNVPIPPKRPDVMSVSPAYIEYLRNKKNTVPEEKIIDQPVPSADKRLDIKTTIEDIDSKGILNALSLKVNSIASPPTPTKKPLKLSSAKILNNIEAQAGDETETTLISFALQPGEIHLNADIEMFLKNHALSLLNKDNTLIMHIHAYATPIDNAEYSDVRLSLARALEVRSFLIKNNISPSRLKLSPMGNDDRNNSDDRIDLVFSAQKY